jgi:hypothetical protein
VQPVCEAARDDRKVWFCATSREAIDPIPDAPQFRRAEFTPDGEELYFVRLGALERWHLWGLGGPALRWLPDLAEAVGGFALNEQGVTMRVRQQPQALAKVRETVAALPGSDAHERWAKWFFADRNTRADSPFAIDAAARQNPAR